MFNVKVNKKRGKPAGTFAVDAYVDEPILPDVTPDDAGKVIGVNENGELEAVNAGGGGGDFDIDIWSTNTSDSAPTATNRYTVVKKLTRADFISKFVDKQYIKARLVRRYQPMPDPEDPETFKHYFYVFSWAEYSVPGTGYKLHFNEIKTTTMTQLTLTFNDNGELTAASTS